ncbi:MAG: hypothetical protein HZB51_14055 [Chloroflexi bacterium]|nr:hypothetical protein [Chloroflexota bacterium]
MSQRVDVNGFLKFIDGQRDKIAKAFKEIEELQKLYQGSYTQFKTNHDKTLLALVNQIESASDGVSRVLNSQVEARVPDEKKLIVMHVDELKRKTIPTYQKQADKLLAQAQNRANDLRTQNPKLNDREEQLKADIAAQKKTLDDLNAQIQKLGSGLGFIFNVGKIHGLDARRNQTVGRLQALSNELNQVRQEWKKLHDDVGTEENALRAQLQTVMVHVGEFRQEHDYLAQNTDGEAHRRAIRFVIDNLKTRPADTNDATLMQMVNLNIQTDDFQAALGSVAGILGVLKGVEEGLGRLSASVTSLASEQSTHSAHLPTLQFELPDNAVAFGRTWDDLYAKSKDEKNLASHPADFVAAMQPFLNERLTKDHIASFFDGLGSAITRATAGWKGK